MRGAIAALGALALTMIAGRALADPVRFPGADCVRPPPMHCPPSDCPTATVINGGPVTDPQTGRSFFLDYPCDLREGEPVIFILSLHGGGSFGNWQRHYFPLVDYVDRYRLVVATPHAPPRVWRENDDAYLQSIVNYVSGHVGRRNIRAFWLAGHSQGGLTSRRLVCTPFFRDRVDGFLSLSGGRLGPMAPPPRDFFGGPPPGAAPGAGAQPATPGGPPPGQMNEFQRLFNTTPDCDFSFIFSSGERELGAPLPTTSVWADRFDCRRRVERRRVSDSRAGYVWDPSRQNPHRPAWGGPPGPGEAQVFVWQGCRDGRLVADVIRLQKGHTEGLEPNVTEQLVRLMISAPGGKFRRLR